MKQHIINTDNDPIINDGYSIKEHKKIGYITWDPLKAGLYLDEWQCDNKKVITGYELYEKLSDLMVLNENVLNYLLENQELIPDTWKWNSDKEPLEIYFWGTIYHNKGGDLVRFLKWSQIKKSGNQFTLGLSSSYSENLLQLSLLQSNRLSLSCLRQDFFMERWF